MLFPKASLSPSVVNPFFKVGVPRDMGLMVVTFPGITVDWVLNLNARSFSPSVLFSLLFMHISVRLSVPPTLIILCSAACVFCSDVALKLEFVNCWSVELGAVVIAVCVTPGSVAANNVDWSVDISSDVVGGLGDKEEIAIAD